MTQQSHTQNSTEEKREQIKAEIRERYDIDESQQMDTFVAEINEVAQNDIKWIQDRFTKVVDLRTGTVDENDPIDLINGKTNDYRHQVQIYKVADVYFVRHHNETWGEREVVQNIEDINLDWIDDRAIMYHDDPEYEDRWETDIVKDELGVTPDRFRKIAQE